MIQSQNMKANRGVVFTFRVTVVFTPSTREGAICFGGNPKHVNLFILEPGKGTRSG